MRVSLNKSGSFILCEPAGQPALAAAEGERAEDENYRAGIFWCALTSHFH